MINNIVEVLDLKNVDKEPPVTSEEQVKVDVGDPSTLMGLVVELLFLSPLLSTQLHHL
ncbi:hypothetical protein [Pseudovibrio sp. Tun.PSC04-5.I4]|uniref:hypothetical protein n=1 Tax=Pseudovibrio sp. Tun.PSC04-5.I4 TaxID=1798213 RepID=UPI0013565D60|nr:hypothetical protein [Pseudovibrio sp. Tun.PSC04-5.I4]